MNVPYDEGTGSCTRRDRLHIESAEEREARLQKMWERQRERLATESPKQWEARL